MKIYSFWSGDTTYYTKSKNLKKAQAIGKENMNLYLANCKYLEEIPEVDKSYFIPEEVEEITPEWFNYSIKTDIDTLVLDEELYRYLDYRANH